jgi:hypothetical protein
VDDMLATRKSRLRKAEIMKHLHAMSILAAAVACSTGCDSGADSTGVQNLSSTTILDLEDVRANPSNYEWFDFRPNVLKLILSGAAETEHVAILWYTVSDGSVGMHYHAKTESVYVIEGTQTDAKGVYPTGTVYFNPPGSGHQISNSSGFFILAYASPPDFASTDKIQEYTPIRIDTAAPSLTSDSPFEEKSTGVRTFAVPLDVAGGMKGEFIELTSPADAYEFRGNYLLVLSGTCTLAGKAFGRQTLLVAQTVEPQSYMISASSSSTCLAMGVSF